MRVLPFCKTATGFGWNGFVMSITWVEFVDGEVTNAYVAFSTCKAGYSSIQCRSFVQLRLGMVVVDV